MGTMRWFVNGVIRLGTSMLCRIDKLDLDTVPACGPLIVYTNHIGSLEVPLLFAHLQPRPVIGMAKAETWDSPFMAWLFNLWGAIPVRRGEVDMEALRKSLTALGRGDIFGIAPEGTRNRTGRLLRAHPGVVTLALRSGAPLLPMVHWGGERFRANLKRLRRTDFRVRVGRPFYLYAGDEKITRHVRQQMVDEMMYQLALLLPAEYRGAYSEVERATQKYLRYI
ncbi:MAG: lysophospholipid acyltransferase family protein [Chloroflexota bacterium]